MGFVDGDRGDWRRHRWREWVDFMSELLLSVGEVALVVEGTVSLVGEMPTETGLIIFLFFTHGQNIISSEL